LDLEDPFLYPSCLHRQARSPRCHCSQALALCVKTPSRCQRPATPWGRYPDDIESLLRFNLDRVSGALSRPRYRKNTKSFLNLWKPDRETESIDRD